ncbi:hypothetical protein [Endozoicomonas sp. Mp262]|uniref:hypothetical protein n=1 Tax=Endozoicomonas sp. Mp262 TaxID=2919499 RepID=UPI0021D9D435
MSVEWPDALGVWLLSGYSYDQNIELVQTKQLGFSPGSRVRQENPPEHVTAKLLLSDIQRSLFDWFYIKRLYYGALFFMAPVKRAGVIERKRAKIISAPTASHTGNHWTVSLKLELYD